MSKYADPRDEFVTIHREALRELIRVSAACIAVTERNPDLDFAIAAYIVPEHVADEGVNEFIEHYGVNGVSV